MSLTRFYGLIWARELSKCIQMGGQVFFGSEVGASGVHPGVVACGLQACSRRDPELGHPGVEVQLKGFGVQE